MGFRFSLEDANWLAHVIQGTGATPQSVEEIDKSGIVNFLESFDSNFMSSAYRESHVSSIAKLTANIIRNNDFTPEILAPIRNSFKDIPWVSLFLPSGRNSITDDVLTSPDFLREMVSFNPDNPGLILQLTSPPKEKYIVLNSVFPAFKKAIAEATRWPGILLWTLHEESAFFSLPKNKTRLVECSRWIYEQLAKQERQPNLKSLKENYYETFKDVIEQYNPLKIIQLSDVHLGSKVANERVTRIKGLIRNIVSEIGSPESVLPVLTGDIMDTPSDDNYDKARDFCDFMFNLGTIEPLFLIGNHDVRRAGFVDAELKYAIRFPGSPLIWYDKFKTGILCFDSCVGGNLARGKIGDRQFMDMGNLLDRSTEKTNNYALIAALHHHPIPINPDKLPHQAWYKKLFSSMLEKTLVLEDANTFNGWIRDRNVVSVIHGHKHIPRAETKNNISYIGCGSSVGKVPEDEQGNTNISVNIITIDTDTRKLSCQLRSEVRLGGGLTNSETYEIIYRKNI